MNHIVSFKSVKKYYKYYIAYKKRKKNEYAKLFFIMERDKVHFRLTRPSLAYLYDV